MGARDILLIAPEADAPELAATMEPLGQAHGIHLDHHNSATLSVLFAALSGDDVNGDNAVACLPFRLLHTDDEEDGPWVYAIPNEFWDRLMNHASPEALARTWAKAELLEYHGEAELVTLLEQLRRLATTAAELQKPILFWSSN